ncbi:hypothetical protein [Cohnella faecalis]|uniref:hypothetical protein n=1 Tax=Cohnella faecalis TaxID=2315694 RepID=UPI002D765F4F|nr:hypothetical protein [Cohnella faecalis]
MSRKTPVSAYYKREARLSQWLEERGDPTVSIDGWEGKKKKVYADRFRAPSFDRDAAGPHFVYMTTDTANSFASFSTFESWIVNVRLLLPSEPKTAHPMLERYRHRWSPSFSSASVTRFQSIFPPEAASMCPEPREAGNRSPRRNKSR